MESSEIGARTKLRSPHNSSEVEQGYSASQTLERVSVSPQLDESTFTGREAELKQLEEQLFNQSGSPVGRIAGIFGGAGVGKTTLAYHFATIHQDKFPHKVIRVNVNDKSTEEIAIELFQKFSRKNLDLEYYPDVATLMQETFAKRRMLLIFDGFDGAVDKNIKQLRPGGNLCSVIITARNRNVLDSLDIPMEGRINLTTLPKEEAYQLLEKILGAERVRAESEAAYEIVRLVGCLPLALQITGKGLRNAPQSLAGYLKDLQQEKTRLFLLEVWGDETLNVTASLKLSLDRLNQAQKDFFACLSVCAEDGFARPTAAAAGGYQNGVDAQKFLNVLSGLSLLNYAQTGENRFVFHTLVRVYARNLAEENNLLTIAQERHAKFFIEWLQSPELENTEVIPEVAESLDDVILAAQWLQNQNQESLTEQDKKERYEFILKLQPLFEENGYYEKAIKLMKTFQSWAKEAKDWNAVVKYQMHEARYLSFAKEFEKAEKIIKEAEENLKKLESTGHSKYKERKAKLLNVSGGIFQKQDKIQEAIKAFKAQALIDLEMGNDQSLLIICIRLGRLLESQGIFEEARLCFKKGIKVSKKINDQFQLAICLHGLGRLMYSNPNKKENAIKLLTEAAAIYKNFNKEQRAAGIYIMIGGFYLSQYYLSDKTYLSQHLLDKSLTMFLLTVEFYQNIDSLKIIKSLRSLAKEFHLRRNYKQAFIALKYMMKICLDTDNKKYLAIAYHRLGLIYLSNKQFIKSQKAFEYEIIVALEINDIHQLYIGLRQLNHLCDRFIKENNFVNAENLFKRLIKIFYKYNAQPNVSIALNRLGQLLEKQGKFAEAQQAFERQVLIVEKLDDQRQKSAVLNCLGRIFEKQGNIQEAQKRFERSIEISRELNNQHQLASTLYHFGLFLKKQGEIERAISSLEESACLFKDLGENKKAGSTYMVLGGVYQNQKNLHDCLRVFSLAAEFHQDLDCSAIMGSLRGLANGFRKKKEFDKALHSINTLVNICLMTENKKQLSIAYDILGTIQIDNKNLLEAQKAFEKEIAVAEETNDLPQLALGLFRLVELMKSQRKLKSIENLLEKSSEIFEDSKDWANFKKVLCIRSDIQEINQKWHEAEKLLLHAYNLAYEKLKNKQNQAVITNRLGQVIANQKGEEKFQLAKMYFRESIKLGVELNDQSHLAKVYTAMGQAFLANGNFEQAVNKLSEGFAIDETLVNIRGLKFVIPDLTDALDRLGRQQEALDYCDRCLEIAQNDSEFLQLKKKIQVAISNKISVKMIKIGVIVFIKCNAKDNSHWGKIAPNDKSSHISFNEKFVGSEIISKLTKGTLVLVVFEEKSEKFYAKIIELVE